MTHPNSIDENHIESTPEGPEKREIADYNDPRVLRKAGPLRDSIMQGRKKAWLAALRGRGVGKAAGSVSTLLASQIRGGSLL
jgi:hypothetical protein